MPKNKGIAYLVVSSIMFLLAPLSIATFVYATSSSSERLASEFLRITGLNMSSCSISPFDEYTSRMPNSPHYLTSMKAEIEDNGAKFEVHICLVDGKIWSYTLSGDLTTVEVNANVNATRAENVLEAYRMFSNASYCNEFVGLVSTAIQTNNSSAENDDFALKISNSESTNQSKYMTFHYSRKIKGHTLQGDCFAISISKNGLLSSLIDSMMYYVTTTAVNVSEEEAIAMAVPYATVYANLHGRTILFTNATFDFARDIGCVRGDDFAIYPRWTVSFTFDIVNNESVYGYAVALWADNGQVYYNTSQGFYAPSANASSWQMIAIVVGLFVLFPITTTYITHKIRTGRGRK